MALAVPHAAYRTEGWALATRLLKDGRRLVTDVTSLPNRGVAL